MDYTGCERVLGPLGKYGQIHHPATEQKKHIPVGMAGDDAKYTLAGSKIICMLLNFPLQQVMRVMAEPIVSVCR